MKLEKWLIPALLIIASDALSFTCPKSYQNVNIGDSQSQVMSKCGPPLSQSTRKEIENKDVNLDIWTYQQRTKIDYRNNGNKISTPPVTFIFSENTLMEMTVSGVSATTASVCGASVSVKESTKGLISSLCGAPDYQTTQSRTIPTGRVDATYWVYKLGPYEPEKNLKFVNGKLISID